MSDAPLVEARPASTVIVLRPAPADRFEVLLMRRNDTVAFMAGAYVFPGGRVEAADRESAVDPRVLSEPPRFADLSAEEEWPYRAAAVREMAEEAAIVIDPFELVPVAHWVTPEAEKRRYDTRFFVAQLPRGQEVRHDGVETTAFIWVAPADALEQCMRGEIQLPPPTWTSLRQLERHHSMDNAFDWARRTPIARMMPKILRDREQPLLVLPGDPLFPAADGPAVSSESRFSLIEGRGWLPTPR